MEPHKAVYSWDLWTIGKIGNPQTPELSASLALTAEV